MSGELFRGRRIRILTIVDDSTRESLAIDASQRFRGEDVVDIFDRIIRERGGPKAIRVNNGPEFMCKALDHWAYWNRVELDFSRPGKPTDNAFIEAFNGKLRAECFDENWFLSLRDARDKLKAWRRD